MRETNQNLWKASIFSIVLLLYFFHATLEFFVLFFSLFFLQAFRPMIDKSFNGFCKYYNLKLNNFEMNNYILKLFNLYYSTQIYYA